MFLRACVSTCTCVRLFASMAVCARVFACVHAGVRLCVRVLVMCVYVHLCELVRVRLYSSSFLCVGWFVRVCVRMCMSTCTYAFLSAYVHICVRARLSLRACIHLCIYVSVQVCVYISCVKWSERVHPFPKELITCYSNFQAASNQYLNE